MSHEAGFLFRDGSFSRDLIWKELSSKYSDYEFFDTVGSVDAEMRPGLEKLMNVEKWSSMVRIVKHSDDSLWPNAFPIFEELTKNLSDRETDFISLLREITRRAQGRGIVEFGLFFTSEWPDNVNPLMVETTLPELIELLKKPSAWQPNYLNLTHGYQYSTDETPFYAKVSSFARH